VRLQDREQEDQHESNRAIWLHLPGDGRIEVSGVFGCEGKALQLCTDLQHKPPRLIRESKVNNPKAEEFLFLPAALLSQKAEGKM
jgi:hypothetical protein